MPRINRFGVLLILVLLLVLTAWRFIVSFHQLKTDQRVVLTRDQIPAAIVSFQATQNQLIVYELDQSTLDLESFGKLLAASATQSASLVAPELLYSLFLEGSFDQIVAYQEADYSRESLLRTFAHQKSLRAFLQNSQLVIRQQRFNPQTTWSGPKHFACPVALVNTTGEFGLASTWSRILDTGGFSIIRKDSNQDQRAQSTVAYDASNQVCGDLVKRLQVMVPTLIVADDAALAQTYRADLVLYLGRDVADLYLFFVNFFQR